MLIADLHIHSRYSRATSRDGTPEYLDLWARRKGIGLLGTGDFTHPAWRGELGEKLEPAEKGFYTIKKEYQMADMGHTPRFVVSGEISSIYKKDGKVRKVHNLILLPGLEQAEALSKKLEEIGNVHSDGRPILGLDSRDLLEITLGVCPEALFIPAHIWTPHFSMFGAFSGFDTVEECFGDLSEHIHALETGLSSDPPMNWRLSALDKYLLVSNSDAHSPQKLGREANLLEIPLCYEGLSRALTNGTGLLGTIEFFPEEGKYHLDGHRKCGVCLTPSQAEKAGNICPVCGKKLTTGVLHRVEELADRPEGFRPDNAKAFESLSPLPEIIAASTGYAPGGGRVAGWYDALLKELGSEFYILRECPLADIERLAGACVMEGVRRMRAGEVSLAPGFDGEYGTIHLLGQEDMERLSGQLSLFAAPSCPDGTNRLTVEHKKKARPARGKKEEPAENKAPVRSRSASKAKPEAQQGESVPLSSLNERQREAVFAPPGAAAVIAGPGTGKTRTLISRILYLIEGQGVKPESITAVTFTNQAAGEMRERLQTALGASRAQAVRIGTFHGVCVSELERARGERPAVIGEAETLLVAGEILEELSLKSSRQRFLQAVSRRKNRMEEEEPFPRFTEAFSLYSARLAEYGVYDYDDLLLAALQTAEEGKEDTARFSHLLVDEFQDIGELQYELIRVWGHKSESIFVIGDPDQSIYGFRGSSAAFFSRFMQDFPNTKGIRLTENYRSTPEILQCALPVIEQNSPSALYEGERRVLTACRPSGTSVKVTALPDDYAAAIRIAKEINRLTGGMDMLDAHQDGQTPDTPRGFSDIAVLYRTHRQAEALEKCLRIESIPYSVTGREGVPMDEAVRGAAAFFRSLLSPKDLVSLKIALLDGIGCLKEEVELFFQHLRTSESPNDLEALFSCLPDGEGLAEWAAQARLFSARLYDGEPEKVVEDWAVRNGLLEHPSIVRLLGMAARYTDLRTLLTDLTLGREGDVTRNGGKAYLRDTVSLMTLHAAKGLEFPVVFLYGVERGKLPLESSGRAADIEEERRLFYVGMTRAGEELVLTTTGDPSPFLSELPQDRVEWNSPPAHVRREENEQLTLF